MKPCRECGNEISEQAVSCPKCGAPYPSKSKWDGWGYEYKSKLKFFGLPLLHVSFKYRPNRTPVVAKGIIAIGQFGCGVITLAQFGIGVFSICQFSIAAFAVAQFALAYSLIAQFGIYINQGSGQFLKSVAEIVALIGK
ncbi:zinc-ribbon domain-containing protein [Desulforegula conservatrix]|uniref:zinc-ribbon domain-containing protein n=1 Tax=Desulforegula conservatrix TaxID=153026 RepID=UPI0003FF40B4|nr:zinc-ribbon domain-containing protein [Desulforegula conservatrix]